MKTLLTLCLSAIIAVSGMSCASRPVRSTTTPSPMTRPQGTYHKVQAKETLWRIAQAYNVDLDTLIQINRIPDAAKIDKGQLVFIPGAAQQLDIATSLPTDMARDEYFIWPVKGKTISYFGDMFEGKINKGINIQIKPQENVHAVRSGRVSFCGDIKGYGKSIIIEHRDDLSSVYTNAIEILVAPKDYIMQGNVIARTLSGSGRGDYLHFEIRKGNKPHNPLHFLP